MMVQAEISNDGTLKITNPDWWGRQVTLSFPEPDYDPNETPNWQEIKAVLQKAEILDFPRRAPEEILRDLREFREG